MSTPGVAFGNRQTSEAERAARWILPIPVNSLFVQVVSNTSSFPGRIPRSQRVVEKRWLCPWKLLRSPRYGPFIQAPWGDLS